MCLGFAKGPHGNVGGRGRGRVRPLVSGFMGVGRVRVRGADKGLYRGIILNNNVIIYIV